jgi:NitT/TauT family transport system ATP-binding protein
VAKLEFQGVSKAYGRDMAIANVDLVVPSGTFTVLIGPSGCGKTTLLEIAASLVPLSEGQVFLEDLPLTQAGLQTAIVFQQHNLFEWMTVRDNVAFGLRAQGVRKSERRLRASKLLADFGLIEHAHKLPRELSGGMRQRVAIARALVLNPQVLLLDEPFSSLDYQTRRVMQHYLLALWHHSQTTILMVTHDLDEALILADRIVLFSGSPGRVIEVVDIPVHHPRSQDHPRLREIRHHLQQHLEREAALGEFTAAELAAISREGVIADFLEEKRLP